MMNPTIFLLLFVVHFSYSVELSSRHTSGHHHVGAPDYTRMDKPDITLNKYRIGGHTHFETMDMEQTYKLRSEKCLISLAKACNLKRFCYDPDSEKDLVPIIVGKNKIEGGKCPELQENIDSFNVTDGNQWGPCNHGYECSYCEEGASKEPVDVCFICHDEDGVVVELTEIAADIVCEESYWKRFKKGYYDRKYGNGWWHNHHHKYTKNDKCNTDFSPNDIRMAVSSCQTNCTIKS